MVLDLVFFSIDLSFWDWVFSLPTNQSTAIIMAVFGWVITAVVFVSMLEIAWRKYRQKKYQNQWKWVILAVDVPPLFVQTHKAVEQIFAHLSGASITPRIGEIYWMGKKQKWFSFEIVSIEGYIQFLIRTEAQHRDLVEAAIYAQYPEAEITEVEDYVKDYPTRFPNDTYDIMGIDFKLADKDAFPIRTYPEFEYTVSKDVSITDPLGGILENFTRIGAGENLWMQIVIAPTNSKWKKKGIELVKKLIANAYKDEKHDPWYTAVSGLPQAIGQEALNVWHWDFAAPETVDKKKDEPGKMIDLPPGLKSTVESVEQKISKIGFKTKIRVLYIARKEIYNPDRCIDGIIGAMSQFSIQSRNGIVPYKLTKAFYLFREMRLGWIKTIFTSGFKKRRTKTGGPQFILNIEELASVWHFPLPSVKAPLVQKTSVKKAEPPMNLPMESLEASPFKRAGTHPAQADGGASILEEGPEPPPLMYG
ncbi:MAG: hypothetical protein WCX97_00030 [Candidatus Magasanikbacteria bacterium]